MPLWLTRMVPLLVLLVLACTSGSAWAGPPDAEQRCLELIDAEPGSARAIEACERAHAEIASPRTSAALAVALAESGDDHYGRVHDLTRAADSGEQTSPELLALMLRAAVANGEVVYSQQLHDRLADVAGDDWRAHALAFELALDRDQRFAAAKHLRALRKLDPPAAELEALERRYREEVPAWVRGVAATLYWIRIVALGWLFGVLGIVGLSVGVAVLQRRAVAAWTPRSADEPPRVPLRMLARVLLRASLLAYLSALALLAVAMLLVGLVLLGVALMLPGPLRAAVLFMVAIDVAGIAAILHAGLLRSAGAPGFRRRLEDEPELQKLSNAAAKAVGVAPAEQLYFTVDARLEVLQLRARALVIGIELLDALDTEQFSALLTREYARTRESGGAGHFVAPMLLHITQELESQTTSTRLLNPGWYMLRGFHWLYRFIASGAAREQDVLADRWAAIAHGSSRLADAIVSLADVQVRFAARLQAIEAELPRRNWTLANIFTHQPEPRPSEQALAAELERWLATGDALTSGLPTKQRIAKLEALVLPPPGGLASNASQPLRQQIRGRASLHTTGTNAWRIGLERRVNKFIHLEPEMEAAVNRR